MIFYELQEGLGIRLYKIMLINFKFNLSQQIVTGWDLIYVCTFDFS